MSSTACPACRGTGLTPCRICPACRSPLDQACQSRYQPVCRTCDGDGRIPAATTDDRNLILRQFAQALTTNQEGTR